MNSENSANNDVGSVVKGIKHQFMAYRNGIVADALRNAGLDCYNVIFGLNLPQLGSVAGTVVPSLDLAKALWADEKVRESRLLATYIFPKEDVDVSLAEELIASVRTQEEADMLVFKLLRFLPFFGDLKSSVCNKFVAGAMSRY